MGMPPSAKRNGADAADRSSCRPMVSSVTVSSSFSFLAVAQAHRTGNWRANLPKEPAPGADHRRHPDHSPTPLDRSGSPARGPRTSGPPRVGATMRWDDSRDPAPAPGRRCRRPSGRHRGPTTVGGPWSRSACGSR